MESLKNASNKIYINEQVCKICNNVFDEFIQKRRSGAHKDIMQKIYENLCLVVFGGLKEVCKSQTDNEIVKCFL